MRESIVVRDAPGAGPAHYFGDDGERGNARISGPRTAPREAMNSHEHDRIDVCDCVCDHLRSYCYGNRDSGRTRASTMVLVCHASPREHSRAAESSSWVQAPRPTGQPGRVLKGDVSVNP